MARRRSYGLGIRGERYNRLRADEGGLRGTPNSAMMEAVLATQGEVGVLKRLSLLRDRVFLFLSEFFGHILNDLI